MRDNRRSSGINMLAGIVASILLVPVLGTAVANAQRRLADESEVFKAQKQVREPGSPITSQTQKGIGTTRRLPGASVPGAIKSDASPLVAAAAPISSCSANATPANSHTCNI